jgi:hypothetical protein
MILAELPAETLEIFLVTVHHSGNGRSCQTYKSGLLGSIQPECPGCHERDIPIARLEQPLSAHRSGCRAPSLFPG